MLIKQFKYSSQYHPTVKFISATDHEAEKTMKIGNNQAKTVAEELHRLKPYIYSMITGTEPVLKPQYENILEYVAQNDTNFRLMMNAIGFVYDENGDIKSVKLDATLGVPGKTHRLKIQTEAILLKAESPEFQEVVFDIHKAIEDWVTKWGKLTMKQPDLFTMQSEAV